MKTKKAHITTGFEAVAEIAYKTNEVFPIYPCTPTSEMSALVEEWSAQSRQNILGAIPTTFEMQSEAGVAGTMHGALQTGALSSTFTASQGLLLMLPNMYKIAGQLLPNVIHVSTRSIATHALSVFGDHSDIMAARQTGYAFLGSASVQEAQDFALIAQAATLKSRIPFVHFMDGFRTSHETNTIQPITDAIVKKMMPSKEITAHRESALDPNKPVLRGTSQGADVFFQSREAQNIFYKICPAIVQDEMNKFAALTGRQYKLFDYVGHPQAEQLIISMASSTETIEQTIRHLNQIGNKYGLIKVRLFRPFSKKYLLQALPESVKSIAVLDRTKEPGSTGEPLYLDILQSLNTAFQKNEIKKMPKIVGGRYGLSSKEFTPDMVNAVFRNLLQDRPKNNFTVGVIDDVTYLNLEINQNISLSDASYQAVFFHEKTKSNAESFKNIMRIAGRKDNVQGYVDCDYKKSNSRNVAHLRIDKNKIKAPYKVEKADVVFCERLGFITNDSALETIKLRGVLLVTTELEPKALWKEIPLRSQQQIRDKNILVYAVNPAKLEAQYRIDGCDVNSFYTAFLTFKNDLAYTDGVSDLKDQIVQVATDTLNSTNKAIDIEFSNSILGKLLANQGDDLTVRQLPIDGTYPTDTARFNPSRNADQLPVWNPDACTQCGACSMACPQGAIRLKVFDDSSLKNAPDTFQYAKSLDTDF